MMTCAAPSLFAISSFLSEEDVTMTVAPDATASWRPKVETPPVPRMRTMSPPLRVFAGPRRALYAVRAAQGRVEASS